MKNAVISLIVASVVVASYTRFTQAAEVPKDVLARMGLSSMQPMTDEEAARLRGEGLATVFGAGGSLVILPGLSGDISGHFAYSSVPNALAVADSSSAAQSSLSLQINIVGLTATLSIINQATNSGSGYAFAR